MPYHVDGIEYLFAWDFLCHREETKPKKAIFNCPATVVLWDDGTKTVAKAHDGDQFDERIGLLTCCLRKARGNRTSDQFEFLVKCAACMLVRPEEMREFAKALGLMADALELDDD